MLKHIMLLELTSQEYQKLFVSDPHQFLSEGFIQLNKNKVDKIVRLVVNSKKPSIGLIAGIKDGIMKTPFSAPFGGFHYRNESVYISTLYEFIEQLLLYAADQKIVEIDIVLPPSIYQESINAKLINTLVRLNFKMTLPDITNWVVLNEFNDSYTHKASREYYRQALRNKLSFKTIIDDNEKRRAFDVICQNRLRFGRPIYMRYEDIVRTAELWKVDFFGVFDTNERMVASAIFYQFPDKIAYAVFWADTEEGRPLRAMDFLIFNLLSHYKSHGFIYIDLGKSTVAGEPNEGLLRFKETHESISSLLFNFKWRAQ